MDLSKLNEQLYSMEASLINMFPETGEAISGLIEKLNTNKKRFNQNEAFIFSQCYKQMGLSLKDKTYLTETSLVTQLPNKEGKVFKVDGVYYGTCDTSGVSLIIEENMLDYANNRNMTEYGVFKKIAKDVQERRGCVFEEQMFSSRAIETSNVEIERLVSNKYGNDVFYFAYESGSSEGGNYLGDESVYEVSGINMSEKDFPQFLPLFKEVCPDITYIQAEEFKNNIIDEVKETEYKQREYYGNYKGYVIYSVDVKAVYENLKNVGVNLSLNNDIEQENTNNRRAGLRR